MGAVSAGNGKECPKFTLSHSFYTLPGVGGGLTPSTSDCSFRKEIVLNYCLACPSTVEKHLSVVVLTYTYFIKSINSMAILQLYNSWHSLNTVQEVQRLAGGHLGGGLWHLPLQHSRAMSIMSCNWCNFSVLCQVYPAHCILYSMSLDNQKIYKCLIPIGVLGFFSTF